MSNRAAAAAAHRSKTHSTTAKSASETSTKTDAEMVQKPLKRFVFIAIIIIMYQY